MPAEKLRSPAARFVPPTTSFVLAARELVCGGPLPPMTRRVATFSAGNRLPLASRQIFVSYAHTIYPRSAFWMGRACSCPRYRPYVHTDVPHSAFCGLSACACLTNLQRQTSAGCLCRRWRVCCRQKGMRQLPGTQKNGPRVETVFCVC